MVQFFFWASATTLARSRSRTLNFTAKVSCDMHKFGWIQHELPRQPPQHSLRNGDLILHRPYTRDALRCALSKLFHMETWDNSLRRDSAIFHQTTNAPQIWISRSLQ